MWTSPGAPILAHVNAAAQCAKGPAEGEQTGVVISEYCLTQSHHWSHSSETAVPITGQHAKQSSANRKLSAEERLGRARSIGT